MPTLNINHVFKLAFGIAKLDGGAIIAIQIITFLLTYFFIQVPTEPADIQAWQGTGKYNLIISIISIINLAAILYRIAGLTRGVKLSLFKCYSHAVRRWPWLMLTYLLGVILLLSLSIFAIKILPPKALILIVLSSIPVCILVCMFVIDQELGPIQAIKNALGYIKNKANSQLLMLLAVMYCVPFMINNLISNAKLLPYLSLFSALWFLLCHVITVILYVSGTPIKTTTNQPDTKVIIA